MNYLHLPSSSRSTATAWNFPLGIDGFRYADLNRVRRIMALDQIFRDELNAADPALAQRYEKSREQFERGEGQDNAELLIGVARYVDAFIARIFHIQEQVQQLNRRTLDDRTVFDFKKRFLDRQILKSAPRCEELASMNVTDIEFRYREGVAEVLTHGEWADDPERELAEIAIRLLDREAAAKKAGNGADSERCAELLARVKEWTRVLAFHPALRERRHLF